MYLVPKELDKLASSQAGHLAQRRLARGIKLNHTEATALIASNLQELIRDGNHSVADLMALGKTILGRRHVLPSVPATLTELMVEGNFLSGTNLVTVHDPISSDDGNLELALYGSFLPIPSQDLFPQAEASVYEHEKKPGAVVPVKEGRITLHPERKRIRLRVTSKGDRPIQVGSHYHFIETNPQLGFDRIKAYGYKLDVAAGTSIRFEPGSTKTVTLVEIGGHRVIHGGNAIATGPVDISRADEIVNKLQEGGFAHTPEPAGDMAHLEPFSMARDAYATMFGPTTGDRVRLGATELWIRVEKDLTTYGDECKFGGGKTLREGMGQASGRPDAETLDTVIVNALIVDWNGIYKADIGIKHGLIVGIGKAGSPDIMDGVDPAMIVGSGTDVIAGEGSIVTAGGIDTHIHFICPQQAHESIAAGITTLLGGGTGPSAGTTATTCTPGKQHMKQMLQAVDELPINYGVTGKGNDSGLRALQEQCVAGAAGLKLHEDWGCTPAAIDACLTACDEHDVQCLIHTDTLNESGFVEQTLAAFKGRAIHTYHTEGAGGGHAPDIIRVVEQPHVLPSSTNPTRPYTRNTLDEHLDMLMVCHHLSRAIPEDVAFAESRIRAETIAAEDVLHDKGAISMMSSDSQAMGRCGEVVLRTWHTAHKNKVQRGALPEDEGTGADNFRVKRYVSKYTVNPALAQGMGHLIGSVEVGKLADLVLWKPAWFGTKPSMVIKSGMIACAMMGDPNASIAVVEPTIMRPMFAAYVPETSVTFVSRASIETGTVASYGLRKRVEAVRNCRTVGKKDMKFNDIMPKMRVDPEKYVSKTLATIGRNGADIHVEGEDISSTHCLFELDAWIMLHDCSRFRSTQTFGHKSIPLVAKRVPRVIAVGPTFNTQFEFGDDGQAPVRFRLHGHISDLGTLRHILATARQLFGTAQGPPPTQDMVPLPPLPSSLPDILSSGRGKRHIRGEGLVEIEKGASAKVCKILNVDNGATCAVKILEDRGGLLSRDQVVREVETLRKVSHPNIVEFISTQRSGKNIQIFMELKDGSVHDLATQGLFVGQPKQLDQLLRQMLRALAHLEKYNIVHHDVKPANILYTKRPDGEYHYQLTDFGLCNVIRHAYLMGGTLPFMAPELFPTRYPDHARYGTSKVDVFALLMTLAWVGSLAGSRDFIGVEVELRVKKALEITEKGEFQSLRPMALADPAKRASAAKMLALLGEK